MHQVSGSTPSMTSRILQTDAAEAQEKIQDSSALNESEKASELAQDETSAYASPMGKRETAKLEATRKTTTVEKGSESVLVRSEQAEGFADNFNQNPENAQFKIPKEKLKELAMGIGDKITVASTLDSVVPFIRDTLKVDDKPPSFAEIHKGMEFIVDCLKYLLDKASAAAKPAIGAILKRMEEIKNQFYNSHERDIEITTGFINRGGVEETGIPIEAAEKILTEVIHNQPEDLFTKFHKSVNAGKSIPQIEKDITIQFRGIGVMLRTVETETDMIKRRQTTAPSKTGSLTNPGPNQPFNPALPKTGKTG